MAIPSISNLTFDSEQFSKKNQPTTVMGIGAAIVALIGIYISLLQKYQ